MKLILASASPRRAEILRDSGMSFTVMSSAVDETPIPGESPNEYVHRLACAKAELVAARSVGPAIIIGADTVVVLDGQIIGKPRSAEDARRTLQLLSGRTHSVVTGVMLIRLPDEPYDKAGAYAIQGRAGRYISRIEGCYFNVVGMPLARLWQELTELGWSDEFLD
jgi:septum formation protein